MKIVKSMSAITFETKYIVKSMLKEPEPLGSANMVQKEKLVKVNDLDDDDMEEICQPKTGSETSGSDKWFDQKRRDGKVQMRKHE